jgi:hypothetical protein
MSGRLDIALAPPEERSLNWLRRNTPLPRHGTAEDFTGQTIVVDGGWTTR